MKLRIALAIMVYFVLLIILVLNMEDKSKTIKYSFFLFIMVLFIALFFVNELVMDYIMSMIIKYIYYPSFTAIIVTLLLTMATFIYNIFNDEMGDKVRIINYVFTSFIFVGYIIFMMLNIDINSYNALYNGNSLLCLRYISRTFIIWFIVNVIIKYYHYFLRKE